MLRFVIRRRMLDAANGLSSEGIETLDIECQELEKVLLGGGYGENQYDYRELVGVEFLPESERSFTEQQLSDACLYAEIPDSKFESLLIALRA